MSIKCENLTDVKALLVHLLDATVSDRVKNKGITPQRKQYLNRRIARLKSAIIVVDREINLKKMEGEK